MESNTSALALKRTSVVGDSAVHREAMEGANREGHEGEPRSEAYSKGGRAHHKVVRGAVVGQCETGVLSVRTSGLPHPLQV
jgi:hypothetical protein